MRRRREEGVKACGSDENGYRHGDEKVACHVDLTNSTFVYRQELRTSTLLKGLWGNVIGRCLWRNSAWESESDVEFRC